MKEDESDRERVSERERGGERRQRVKKVTERDKD